MFTLQYCYEEKQFQILGLPPGGGKSRIGQEHLICSQSPFCYIVLKDMLYIFFWLAG